MPFGRVRPWRERPPSFDAWYGIERGGSLRSSNPVREGHRSPGTGASRTWRLGLWPEPSGVPRPCSVMPGCQTAGRSANG